MAILADERGPRSDQEMTWHANAPETHRMSVSSQSTMFVRAAQLAADLHQRASLDAEELLRELVEGATEAVPGAQYGGITVTKRRRLSETAAATHRCAQVLRRADSRIRYQVGGFGTDSATHTALVWTILRRDQQFRRALASRDVIGQAKGMLMERFDIDEAAAFVLLKRVSQDSNTPIAQLARRVVAGDYLQR